MKLNTKTAEMGDDDYIKEVGQLSTSEVFFFLQFKKKFYIMDESKNIRVYAQDPITHLLEQEKTLGLSQTDKQAIKYSEFDEYVISHSVLIRDKKVYFFHELGDQDKQN